MKERRSWTFLKLKTSAVQKVFWRELKDKPDWENIFKRPTKDYYPKYAKKKKHLKLNKKMSNLLIK